MLLSAEGIGKSYGDRTMLHDVNFYLERGDKVGVVGVNGTGKSTLLRLITGELAPDEGEITIQNGLRIGYLKQNSGLDRDNTIYEEMKSAFADVIQIGEHLRLLEQEMARIPQAQILVTAIVGMIGIRPTIEAICAGKDIALANKETLVTAGHIIMPLAEKKGVKIYPVDSEHSAIYQCLHGEKSESIQKLLITASGGPFRGKKREELRKVTVEDALRHPNWSMGHKITIDSATLVNKGLEVMEARWLFDVELNDIQVVVQPKSIIHSMVQFRDGAVMAQLGTPDMKLPIQYALFYPDRRPMKGEKLDLFDVATLTFERPDTETFRGLSLGLRAAGEGGSMPTVFNAANEKAVALFLNRQIGFLSIAELIEKCMDHHRRIENPSLEQILQTEAETYEYIESIKA